MQTILMPNLAGASYSCLKKIPVSIPRIKTGNTLKLLSDDFLPFHNGNHAFI